MTLYDGWNETVWKRHSKNECVTEITSVQAHLICVGTLIANSTTIWIQMKLFSKSYICAFRSSWIIINNCHHFFAFTAHTIWQEWTRCRYLEYKSDNQFISFSSVQFIVTNTTWSSQFYYRFDPFTSLLHLVSYFEYPQIFFDKYDTKVANSTFLFTSDWPTL